MGIIIYEKSDGPLLSLILMMALNGSITTPITSVTFTTDQIEALAYMYDSTEKELGFCADIEEGAIKNLEPSFIFHHGENHILHHCGRDVEIHTHPSGFQYFYPSTQDRRAFLISAPVNCIFVHNYIIPESIKCYNSLTEPIEVTIQ